MDNRKPDVKFYKSCETNEITKSNKSKIEAVVEKFDSFEIINILNKGECSASNIKIEQILDEKVKNVKFNNENIEYKYITENLVEISIKNALEPGEKGSIEIYFE